MMKKREEWRRIFMQRIAGAHERAKTREWLNKLLVKSLGAQREAQKAGQMMKQKTVSGG